MRVTQKYSLQFLALVPMNGLIQQSDGSRQVDILLPNEQAKFDLDLLVEYIKSIGRNFIVIGKQNPASSIIRNHTHWFIGRGSSQKAKTCSHQLRG
jgi:hypothetical protein